MSHSEYQFRAQTLKFVELATKHRVAPLTPDQVGLSGPYGVWIIQRARVWTSTGPNGASAERGLAVDEDGYVLNHLPVVRQEPRPSYPYPYPDPPVVVISGYEWTGQHPGRRPPIVWDLSYFQVAIEGATAAILNGTFTNQTIVYDPQSFTLKRAPGLV